MACDEFNPCTDCGCEETPATPPIYVIECDSQAERCEEITTGLCTTYQAGAIVEGLINFNDSLDIVIQKIVEYLQANPQPVPIVENLDTIVTDTTIQFAWDASTIPGAIYKLELSTDQNTWDIQHNDTDLDYLVIGLDPNTTYYYRLSATANGYAQSEYLNGSVTTLTV